MRQSQPPFNKWDQLQKEENPSPARSTPENETPDDTRSTSLKAKMWMLRSAWIISTGMLILGGLLMILILADQGHRIGL